jgi:2-polyprenyl-3-methyl-5-hydroxy-6-metoxy-1,4-benzoquinol methylase
MSCVACNNNIFYNLYDFGSIPLVNNFTKNKKEAKKKYRLDIVYCSKCYLVQIRKNINPKKLFQNYKHISSGSKINVNHLESITKIGLKLNNSKILEIGSNDNSLLKSLSKYGKILCGVDPSINKNIKSKKVHLYKGFFNYIFSNKLKKKFENFNFIFAINVIPHVKNLKQVIKGVSNILNEKGLFILEGVYLRNNIEKGYFDTFYHEHVSTFSLFSLNKLLNRYGLKIVKVELLKTQGGSFRVYAAHTTYNYKISNYTNNLIKNELSIGINNKIYYNKLNKSLGKRINLLKFEINRKIKKIKIKRYKIIALGAPARGVVITSVLNITNLIDHYIDDSQTKHNKYFPGTNIKVINWRNKNILKCKHFILLSWNYEQEIIKKILMYKKEDFYLIKVFPYFKIIHFKKT